MVAAIPRTPPPAVEPEEREYEVVSHTCVWGEVGEVIKLALTDNQELSLLQAGTVKRAKVPAKPVVQKKEGK